MGQQGSLDYLFFTRSGHQRLSNEPHGAGKLNKSALLCQRVSEREEVTWRF